MNISIFNISPILYIQWHSKDSCKCNCTLFLNFWYSYAFKIVCGYFKRVLPKPKIRFTGRKSSFLSLVLEIYILNCVHNGYIRRNCVHTMYAQEKRYCKLIVSLSMLFVQRLYITENLIIVLRFVCNMSLRKTSKIWIKTTNPDITLSTEVTLEMNSIMDGNKTEYFGYFQ